MENQYTRWFKDRFTRAGDIGPMLRAVQHTLHDADARKRDTRHYRRQTTRDVWHLSAASRQNNARTAGPCSAPAALAKSLVPYF